MGRLHSLCTCRRALSESASPSASRESSCACLAPSAEAAARFAAALERAHDVDAHVLELAPGADAAAALAAAPGAPFDLVVAAPALAAKGEEGLPPGALVAKPADALAAIRAARAEAVS